MLRFRLFAHFFLAINDVLLLALLTFTQLLTVLYKLNTKLCKVHVLLCAGEGRHACQESIFLRLGKLGPVWKINTKEFAVLSAVLFVVVDSAALFSAELFFVTSTSLLQVALQCLSGLAMLCFATVLDVTEVNVFVVSGKLL